jgi:trans-aconitate methyltransferase
MRRIWNITGHFYSLFRAIPGINFIYRQEKKALSELLEKLTINEPIQHLDLGSGNGSTYDIFPPHHQICAIDHSASMLAALKKKYPNVTTICGDLFDTIPDEKFDLISLIGVSEYISELPLLLNLIGKHLQENGALLITAANPSLWNQLRRLHGHRLWLRKRENLRLMLQDVGFCVMAEKKTLLQIQLLARLKS